MEQRPPSPNLDSSGLPLYRQVEQHLREQIRSGVLKPGEILPSVRELCEQFGGINHLTVRQALKNLADENLIRSIKGRGCFVNEGAMRSRSVAIVLPHLEGTLFRRIAHGAQEVFEANGVQSLIMDSRGSQETEANHLQSLGTFPLNGAVVFPITHGNIAEQVFKLKMSGFTFVLVDRYFEDIATSCVMADSFKGGYDSAAHLIAQGRRRVAWVGETRSSPARLRLQGIQAALSSLAGSSPGVLIKNIEIAPAAPDSYREAADVAVRRAVSELMEVQPAVEAIIFSEDGHALTALRVLKERGVAVPGRVALVGYDDLPEAAGSGLTTVRQPMVEIGREAARLLLEQMGDGGPMAEKKVLPVELVVRGSS